MSFLLRVHLPDRPGSLGAFTTALGAVDVDIVSLEIVERYPGFAIDDLVVRLPTGALPDRVLTAAHTVPDLVVESLRPFHGTFDVHQELALLESLAREPDKAMDLLADAIPSVFRASWAAIVEAAPPVAGGLARTPGMAIGGSGGLAVAPPVRTMVVAASGGAPELSRVPAPYLPLTAARRLDPDGEWLPSSWRTVGTELAVAPVGSASRAVLVGRSGGPEFRPGEVIRLAHLSSIAATVQAAAEG